MLNLDPAKLLVIFVIALVVLGPERLPKVARQLAGVWREFTRIKEQVSEEVRQAIPEVDLPRVPSASGAIAGLLADVRDPARARRSPPTAPEVSPESRERVAPPVVLYPGPGDVAFLPDDPSMN